MPATRVQDERSPSEKDGDRILYSSAFRRLTGVTQVVSVTETALFHNRLTHTIKVAQLAERLAQDLVRGGFADSNQIDVGAAKAGALAHDLGHPPFGHVAEAKLSDLCTERGIDGFEGNAQSFRILTKLARRASAEPGLGLSPRTLNAVLKYPWFRTETRPTEGASRQEKHRWKKWGAYRSEGEAFAEARAGDESAQRSIEAEIMDWADDVSYALHDLEDFYRVGLLPLERLADERDWFTTSAAIDLGDEPTFDPDLFSGALRKQIGLLPKRAYTGSDEDRQTLHQQTNGLIDAFFSAVRVNASGRLVIDAAVRHEVMLIKQLTWQYVVNSPALATLQQGQTHIIETLFVRLYDWLMQEFQVHRLPTRLQRIRDAVRRDDAMTGALGTPEAIAARTAADYIAGLTEEQAIDLYRRLYGLSSRSILEGWVRW